MSKDRREYCKMWRKNNPDKVKSNYLKHKGEDRREYYKEWRKKNLDKVKKNKVKHKGEYYGKYKEYRKIFMRRWRKENPDLARLYNVSSKIKIPEKKICEKCNLNLAKEKHHPNYNKPLIVEFLCINCHKEVHKCQIENKNITFLGKSLTKKKVLREKLK